MECLIKFVRIVINIEFWFINNAKELLCLTALPFANTPTNISSKT